MMLRGIGLMRQDVERLQTDRRAAVSVKGRDGRTKDTCDTIRYD